VALHRSRRAARRSLIVDTVSIRWTLGVGRSSTIRTPVRLTVIVRRADGLPWAARGGYRGVARHVAERGLRRLRVMLRYGRAAATSGEEAADPRAMPARRSARRSRLSAAPSK
jgi:hypothetical protein